MLNTDILELLSILKNENIEMQAIGDKIKIVTSGKKLSKELQEKIVENKAEILNFLKDDVDKLPVLEHRKEGEYEKFPLTDIQQAYWVGRSNDFDMGNVATHIYYEFEEEGLKPELLEAAWKKIIARHSMLRAVIDADGMQRVLKEVPEYKIKQMDLRNESDEIIEERINDLRDSLSHQVLPSNQWPLFDLRISLLPNKMVRLHVSIDLLIADAFSCQILLKELSCLYKNPDDELNDIELTFKDYIDYNEAMKKTKTYKKSLEYWKNRLNKFPSHPQLQLKTRPDDVEVPHFVRKTRAVSKDEWSKIKKRAHKYNVTPSIVLLTAYANILKYWSKNSHFAINLTLFNRPLVHDDISNVIGDFTSLNLLEINFEKNEAFLDQVQGIQNQLFKDLDHKYVSGVQVMRELAKKQGNSNGIAMPIIFTNELLNVDEEMFKVHFNDNEEKPLDIEVVGIGKQVYGISQTPQVWLDFQVGERAGVLTYNWDIAKELFDEKMMDEMFDSFNRLLIQLAEDESKWINAKGALIDYGTVREQVESCVSEEEYKSNIQTILTESMEKYSNNNAIVTKDRKIQYNELNSSSNKVGNWLKEKGASRNKLVAILMNKGWEQVVAVMGTLKAGAAYLPISADLSRERINYFLENGDVDLVLTQSDIVKNNVLDEKYEYLCVDEIDNIEIDDSSLNEVNDSSDLAYVIYTSGSTGFPKGVMISHESMLNTIIDINKRFEISSDDKILAISSLNFDLSVYDIFGMILSGGTIVIPDADSKRNPKVWLELMKKEGVTIWNSVPALFEMLVEYAEGMGKEIPKSLRLTLMSGDWIPVSLINRVKNISKNIKLVSLGGATEAAIWSIYHPIQNSDLKLDSIPYGKPLSNQTVYVMDDSFCQKPIGVPGKILIGGVGVAKGYWKDEEKTNNSFVVNPITEERLYITGDWGYYSQDGNIIFLGREDNQIKLGGYRIELGEIEAAVLRFPNIKSSVIVVKTENGKNKSLQGYYETINGEDIDNKKFMEYLDKQVPEYMIPSSLVRMDKIPLTPNGKIDRNALKEIEAETTSIEYVAPSTEIEKELVEMLASELGAENIGVNDNYFQLGGDSISAIRLLLRIKNKYEIELSAKKIFENPIVSDLAKEIEKLTVGEEEIEVVKEVEEVEVIEAKEVIDELIDSEFPQIVHDEEHAYDPYPLTGLQQAYLVGRSDAVEFGNVACHTYEEIEVVDFKIDLFNKAWKKLTNRHDILRTVINSDGTQSTLRDIPDYEIDALDISKYSEEEKEKYLAETRKRMSHQVMDISKWPLFELKATKLEENVTRLHISIDAMIADAWSVGILTKELCNLYENIDLEMEPLEITTRDYVVGEHALKESEVYKKSLEYWKTKLKELQPAPDLPIIKNTNSSAQHKFKRRRKELDSEMWKRLKNNAGKYGLTPSGIMMATFAEVLTTWSYSSKFTLNVPQFNRLPIHRQVDDLVGEFASFYLMSIDNSNSGTFIERARRIQGDLWQNMNHSIVSGLQILREYSNMNGGGPNISMPIVFTSTIGLIDQDKSLFDGFGNVVYSISQTPQVWLDCQVGEKGNTVIFNWDAVEEIFPEGLLDSMFEAYCNLLDMLADDEDSWNRKDLSLIPSDQVALIAKTNETYVEREAELLHVAFANQAAKNPDNIAVISKDKNLTYNDLLLYADQLGEWLIDKGAKTNQLVGIVMEKGWEQIVAVMSVLNSGAAFLPIDIDLPKERIQYILDNSGVEILLTQSKSEDMISYNKITTFVDKFELNKEKEPVIKRLQNVDDLAYVIYTSGSTGQPKGVKISHENVDNMVFHTNTKLNINASDRAIAVTALHHDLSIYDVFGMLSAGGSIVMPEHSLRLDLDYIYKCMENEQVTLWNSVPAIMDMLTDQLIKDGKMFNSELRQIILGGDWIPIDLPKKINSLSDKVQLLGIGGPTETTVWNIWYPISEVKPEWHSIPYGKPISNSKYYVMDENCRVRPTWVTGEMYCAGIQLSSGYLNDEVKTNSKYLIHPETGERLYKTGDLGRYLPDGNIEFMGRADFQVKINGLRIELGEIEAVVSELPGVKTSVAAVVGENQSKKIVSFVILDKGDDYESNDEINIKSLESENIITDPFERLEFKQKKLGIRKEDEMPFIQLKAPTIDEDYKELYIDRRSYRKFVKEKISIENFTRLLSSLLYYNFESLPFPKYRYASAGGLYPVQAYIYVKDDRVEGVSGGAYYFKPDENKLIQLDSSKEFDSTIFPPGNREIFDESAFTILLVGNLKAIKPMYGPLTNNFCYLEAGIISQLLEATGIENQIGFCQIGNLEFDKLRDMFKLDESYKYLHCLIGGGVDIYKDKYLALEDDWSGYKITDKDGEEKENPVELIEGILSEKLPAYMIPSQIIILDKLPITPNGKIDRKAISEFVDLSVESTSEFVEPKTNIEIALADLISKYVDIDKVGMNDNLFQLGADSLVAIQLSSQLRKLFQVEISLKELFTSPTVGDIAQKIEINGGTVTNTEVGGLDEELPVLVEDLDNRYEPFPLTDVQEAYWVGRNSFVELGNISTHVYLEIEQRNLDINIFEKSWQKMIDRHEMLRAIIRNDGQQQILKEVPHYKIGLIDLKEADKKTKETELNNIRERMSHQILKADEWPLFEIKASLLKDDVIRLHVSIDLLISDVWSARIVTRELMDIYTNDAQLPPLSLSFRDYVIAEKSLEKTDLYKKSWDYWQERIKTLAPAPELPLAKNPANLSKPCFERRIATIEQVYWDKLKAKANKLGVTHSGLLAAAYAEVLSMWSRTPHFTLNLTLFNRLPFSNQVNEIVGDFTSLILLEIDNDINDSFENRVIKVQEQILEDIDHRYVSGVKVIREISKQNKDGMHATMPVVFTSTLNLGASEYPSGSVDSSDDVYGISQTPQIWLDHVVSEQNGKLVMNWDAIEELFPEGMLDNMFETYCSLLHRLAEDEKAWSMPRSELLPVPIEEIEIREVQNEFEVNGKGITLNQLFNMKSEEQPNNIAVISSKKVMTYKELNILSNKVGNLIINMNKNQLVPIIMEKGIEQIVAALGVLQSGYAYLPISCELPEERIIYLLENSNASVVLTQSWLNIKLPEGVQKINVDEIEQLEDVDQSNIIVKQSENDLAYVIYTSGSTGQPKGVAIDHKGAINTILDINKRFKVTEGDRVLALSELNFDLSVYDVFGLLTAGGTIVIPDPQDKKNPESWMKLMLEEEVTVFNSVPALMEMLVEYAKGSSLEFPQSLRLALLSGDWIPVELPGNLRALNNNVDIISLGGATEASIWSIFYKIDEVKENWKSIPYGKALSNQSIYVLDESLAMRPNWVPGEIYIGGIGVARCYWNDEELTNKKFIINPKTGERLYRTGDLGCYLPDGNIEFLGRADYQVKIMGHRIELGEIENALNSHPYVKNSVVTVSEDSNNKSLVGYYTVDSETVINNKLNKNPLLSGASYKPVIDPIQRLQFKINENGVRKDLNDSNNIKLNMGVKAEELRQLSITRRSYRKFHKTNISHLEISGLLNTLGRYKIDGVPMAKLRYGSAGSLYPIQAYIYVKENRIEGIDAGLYYYNPENCELWMISDEFRLDPSFYQSGNREVFEEGAFSIFLVGKMDAIKPMYGEEARAFCLLESGIISQLLEMEATKYGIGLCQIGSLDYEPIREWFKLDDEHVFMHNIIGGKIEEKDSSLGSLIEGSSEVMKLVNMVKVSSVNNVNNGLEFDDKYSGRENKKLEKVTILDPVERAKYKFFNKGIRNDRSDKQIISLDTSNMKDSIDSYVNRRSIRKFDNEILTVQELGDFLSCLVFEQIDKLPFSKARYSSAGTLHPVQTYIYVKREKIEGLDGGIYYYNPIEHSLVEINKDAQIDDRLFPAGNREIFENANFAVFMVAQSKAIVPLYPKYAYEFSLMEAGEMSQLLEMTGVEFNIGLCQIGSFTFDKIAHMFKLDEGHSYLHCLIGGKVSERARGIEGLLGSFKNFNEELDSVAVSNIEEEEKKVTHYEYDSVNNNSLLTDLNEYLQQKLPNYMVPKTIIELEEFPLTPNGKVDRKNLPKVQESHVETLTAVHEFVPPNTELEKKLAEIWCSTIGAESIGVHDNFFDLGGNSMHLVKAYNKMKEEVSEELAITELFEHPTIYSLSEHLKNNSNITKIDGDKRATERRLRREQRRRRN